MIEMVYASKESEESTEIFESKDALLRFKQEFTEKMEKILAEQRQARAKSEEDVRRRRIF
ncbi:MAG: hypothetical protein ACPGSB_02875 [Opitutales bacterium]